ncbi:MAG: helix-turn-helix transcriptional regulator [bacterium]|nr:helix-turn-helix transcriptional regulator [bacterium]
MAGDNGSQAFDPADLDDESLVLYGACRELALARGVDGESALAAAFRAMREGDPLSAISHLRDYVTAYEIDLSSRPKINGMRLAELRDSKNIKAKDLCQALGVSTAALSQLEKGRSAIRFMRVLPAAEIIGCDPRKILVGYMPSKPSASSHQRELQRTDRRRRAS